MRLTARAYLSKGQVRVIMQAEEAKGQISCPEISPPKTRRRNSTSFVFSNEVIGEKTCATIFLSLSLPKMLSGKAKSSLTSLSAKGLVGLVG